MPPFCKHAGEVVTRALDPDSTSTDLARIVLKDLGLTSLFLRMANSAMYNRSGRPVMSVAHAIILLGWDTVRNLVSTVRYIEYFAARGAGVREMLLLSVLSAAHSRDIAAVIGYPSPEEAHVAGLFRNMGEIVIGCHYPQEYSSIILKMHAEKIDGRAACMRVLGFGWDDVGGGVAEAWNLPSNLIRCLRGSDAAAGSLRDRSLASITDYARDLTHALYRKGCGIDSVHLRCVDDAEGRRVLVSVRDLCRIVDRARVGDARYLCGAGNPDRAPAPGKSGGTGAGDPGGGAGVRCGRPESSGRGRRKCRPHAAAGRVRFECAHRQPAGSDSWRPASTARFSAW